MIDIESMVYSMVSDAVRVAYPQAEVVSVTTFSPARFPCVCIEETDNYDLRSTQDSASNENHVVSVLEVNVYSNRASGKKTEAKDILSVVDNTLLSLGYSRTSRTPINLDDATKYRLFARYDAVISKDKTIYRR